MIVEFFKKLIDFLLNASLKKILAGAGLTLSSGLIAYNIVNYYINKLINQIHSLNQMGELSLALFNIGRFDDYFSIIIGAYMIKFTLRMSRVFLSKLG